MTVLQRILETSDLLIPQLKSPGAKIHHSHDAMILDAWRVYGIGRRRASHHPRDQGVRLRSQTRSHQSTCKALDDPRIGARLARANAPSGPGILLLECFFRL